MSGQDLQGTVVSREYPGSSARHYPDDDAAGENRSLARSYAALVKSTFGPRFHIAGRLATYTYIDMDQSMRQGMNAAAAVLRSAG
jgi:UDP-galactopyranose mutase